VKTVVDTAIASHNEPLELSGLELFPSAAEKATERTELQVVDLGSITLEDLRQQALEFSWIALCQRNGSTVRTPIAPVRTTQGGSGDALSGMMPM